MNNILRQIEDDILTTELRLEKLRAAREVVAQIVGTPREVAADSGQGGPLFVVTRPKKADAEPKKRQKRTDRTEMREGILGLMKDGRPRTANDVVSTLGYAGDDKAAVWRLLGKLALSHVLVRDKDGIYQMTAKVAEVA